MADFQTVLWTALVSGHWASKVFKSHQPKAEGAEPCSLIPDVLCRLEVETLVSLQENHIWAQMWTA